MAIVQSICWMALRMLGVTKMMSERVCLIDGGESQCVDLQGDEGTKGIGGGCELVRRLQTAEEWGTKRC